MVIHPITNKRPCQKTRFAALMPLHLLILLSNLVLMSNLTRAEVSPIDEIVAVVNEDVIFASQLQEKAQSYYAQAKQQGRPAPPPKILIPQILEQLIMESLQLELAQRVGLTVSSDEVNGTLLNIARQNNIKPENLRKSIEADGLSFDQFVKSIEKEIILKRIQQAAVTKRINITEQDITNFLNSEEGKLAANESHKLSHIVLSHDQSEEGHNKSLALARQIIDSIQQGKKFSELAKQHSTSPDSAQGGDLGWRNHRDIPSLYIEPISSLQVGEITDPIETADAIYIVKLTDKKGLQKQWVQQAHTRHILIKTSAIRNDKEAAKLLSDLRDEILSGRDFADAAKEHSEDFATALKGGELGWVPPGQMVAEFQQIMDNTAVGTISYPFQTQYGWHILEVQDRRKENMSEQLLRQSVRNLLSQRQYEIELPIWLQELKSDAYIVIKDPSLYPAE